ncbi:MAG TPA: vitamin B12 dependent-methionine synthase activation domain-containing protein [Vicinamibacteria bacterium]|nr:vitamin B12 dependent-methionine synthase activation domain-containing protein [Vicinamibacteria bacterium]
MRETVRFATSEAVPEAEEVLAAQGLPEGDALAPRLRRLLDDALSACSALAEPRAVCEEVSEERFASVLAPLDLNGDGLVVGRVYPRAHGLALFVATLGEPLPARIRRLFEEDALAEAWMLDAVASAAADLLADRLAERFRRTQVERGHAAARVLPYSPGYCGWPTRGQKPLFEALRPEEIGVTLNDSCLMSPIKSVSGVLVAGPGEAHKFRPDFPFCDDCRSHECGRRMASVLKKA